MRYILLLLLILASSLFYRYYHSSSLQLIEGLLTCEAGTYNDNKGCKQCTGDTYSDRGATTCTPADAGYQPSSNYDSEIICPWGTYNPAAGSSGGKRNCTLIPAGYTAVFGDTSAQDKTTCRKDSSNKCLAGEAKTFSNITNPVYTKCNPGYSLSNKICSECPANTYGEGGTKACSPCPEHSTSPIGSDELSDCLAGPGYTGSGSNISPCPKGTFKTKSQSSCMPCPAGKFSQTTGATSSSVCTLCSGGSYSPAGASKCTACPMGQSTGVPAAVGATSCTPCPKGYYTPTGSNQCQKCPPGFYSGTTGSHSCSPCPSGQDPRSKKPAWIPNAREGATACVPNDTWFQWAPCGHKRCGGKQCQIPGDVGQKIGPFECNLGRGNVGPFWTRTGSALPNGSFCNINNDCGSGICSVGCGSTGHVCLPKGVQGGTPKCGGLGITGSSGCGAFAPCAYKYGGCTRQYGGQYDPLCAGRNNRGCSQNHAATGRNLC